MSILVITKDIGGVPTKVVEITDVVEHKRYMTREDLLSWQATLTTQLQEVNAMLLELDK